VELFTPLLYHWAIRLGLTGHDLADAVQDVYVVLVRELPTFSADQDRSFRGWLRTILTNQWRDRRRKHAATPIDPDRLQTVPDPDPDESLAEREYRQHLVQRALELMQKDFAPSTWQACWQTKVCGRSAADVAAELGMTVAAVHAATYRVLHRLREELTGFLD
jgi:RNA polymerase sigma-70 factor (ECF subfamily)